MDIVSKLPTELKELVWSYVDIETKVWVSKYYYEKYHNSIILKNIPNFNKFVLTLIIKKYNYVFDIIYRQMSKSWKYPTRWYYSNETFLSYQAFLKYKAERYDNQYILQLLKGNRGNKGKKDRKEYKDNKKQILGWRK